MRIASLQPSVTLTLAALGRLDLLCAHTKYCLEALPSLAKLRLPIVADSWSTTKMELEAIEPDLIIASVPYRLESLAAILKVGVPLLALAPQSLEDIVRDTRLIANQVDRAQEAESLIDEFQRALAATRTDTCELEKVTVYCEEWGKPLIHSQRWIAELVETSGGIFLGTPGSQTTSEIVANADPDVLIFAWCGAGNRVPLERVVAQRNWLHLRSVHNRRVYCIPDEYLNTPAIPSLTEGLAYIATAIHPERISEGKQLISLF
jgi:iron complex transport system substrate-binding protein